MFPMYFATLAPANSLPAITQPFCQQKHVGSKSSSSTRQQLLKKPYNFITVHRAQTAGASRQVEAGPDSPEAQNPIAAVPEPQTPVLPLSLLGSLSAAWLCTVRGSTALQCGTLLLLDIVYAGLHLQPLLPLFQMRQAPDVAFMKSYTKATYFVSECLLLGWLLSNEVIRASVPTSILAVHGAVHVGFVVLAAQAPNWCMQQQIHRIENGWNVKGLAGKWHVLVNMVNFADLALHLCYISVLWQNLAKTGSPSAILQEPWVVAVVGALLSYLMAYYGPHQQQQQQQEDVET